MFFIRVPVVMKSIAVRDTVVKMLSVVTGYPVTAQGRTRSQAVFAVEGHDESMMARLRDAGLLVEASMSPASLFVEDDKGDRGEEFLARRRETGIDDGGMIAAP